MERRGERDKADGDRARAWSPGDRSDDDRDEGDAAPAKANGKTAGPGHGTPPGKGGARKAAPKKARKRKSE